MLDRREDIVIYVSRTDDGFGYMFVCVGMIRRMLGDDVFVGEKRQWRERLKTSYIVVVAELLRLSLWNGARKKGRLWCDCLVGDLVVDVLFC